MVNHFTVSRSRVNVCVQNRSELLSTGQNFFKLSANFRPPIIFSMILHIFTQSPQLFTHALLLYV